MASFGLPRELGNEYDRIMEPYGFLILLAVCMLPIFGGRSLIGLVLSPFINGTMVLLYRIAIP